MIPQDEILGGFAPSTVAEGRQDLVLPTSAVPTGLLSLAFPTQDFVLGYLQSSLRDWGARQVGKHTRRYERRTTLAGNQQVIRNRRLVRFRAVVQTTVAPFPALVVGNGLEQMDAAKIGP